MKEPSVTFLMAARNAAATASASIKSALSQNYDGVVKLIAVDDGSTDGTLDILRSFDEVTVLSNGVSRGRAAARNAALEIVETEFVAVQDADDVSLPDRLKSSVKVVYSNEAAVAGTQLRWSDPSSGTYSGATWPTDPAVASQLLSQGRMPVAHPSMLMRTSTLREISGYSEKYPVAEDLDLLLRLRLAVPGAVFASAQSVGVVYQRPRISKFQYAFESEYWRAVVLRDNGYGNEGAKVLIALKQALRTAVIQRAKAISSRS